MTEELLPVTQEYRDAAASLRIHDFCHSLNDAGFKNGTHDKSHVVQAFAAHRLATQTPHDAGENNLTKAATDLLNACQIADIKGELADEIDGSLMDAVFNALSAMPKRNEDRSSDGVFEALLPVIHWYQSDEQPFPPIETIITNMVSDLQDDRAKALAYDKLKKAADKLSFAAQSSGGTAGKDDKLIQAIAEYSEAALKGQS